jgi:hypothetical protein
MEAHHVTDWLGDGDDDDKDDVADADTPVSDVIALGSLWQPF